MTRLLTASAGWKRRRLLSLRLCPRFVQGPETRRSMREHYDASGSMARATLDALRRHRVAREGRERPYRLVHLGRRLNACHWAGWDQSRDVGRWTRPASEHGTQGPKWLGAR